MPPRKVEKAAYHHGDLRASLVRAAFALARRAGPDGVSLRAVARRAGVSEAAPYHHFPDKRSLLAAAAGVGFERLDRRVEQGIEGLDPREAIVAFAAAYVEFAIDEPGAFQLMFGAHVSELDLGAIPEIGLPGRRLKARMRALTAAISDEGELLFRTVWAQCHGMAWLVVEKELHADGVDAPDARDAIELARRAVERLLPDRSARSTRR